ncbi:MAG: DinB family protein [Chloroflexi bacterium]|nr:DinB family protein [Chloroflexota bacterium]
MKSDLVKTIFAYQISADRRLWDEVIMPLEESLFYVDTGYSWGSLQRECAHVIDAMHGYMQRLHSSKQIGKAFAVDNPDRAQVRERWDAVETDWKSYITRFDDREFDRRVETIYRDTLIAVPVWQLVFQVFNHNTLHRAEMLQIVAALAQPVDFDASFARYCIRNAE